MTDKPTEQHAMDIASSEQEQVRGLKKALQVRHIAIYSAMERRPEITPTEQILTEDDVMQGIRSKVNNCDIDLLTKVYNLLECSYTPIRVRTAYGIDGQGDEAPTFITCQEDRLEDNNS